MLSLPTASGDPGTATPARLELFGRWPFAREGLFLPSRAGPNAVRFHVFAVLAGTSPGRGCAPSLHMMGTASRSARCGATQERPRRRSAGQLVKFLAKICGADP